jgi:hypothetical protein
MTVNNSEVNAPGSGGKPAQSDRRKFGWYAFLLGPPFRLIGFFYRTYNLNRDCLAVLTSKPWASAGLRKIMVLTLFVWIAIWLLASEDDRNRLTDAVRENFGAAGNQFKVP